MLRFAPTLAVAVALTSCADSFDEDLKAVQDAPFLSTGGTAATTTGASPTTGPGTGVEGTAGESATGGGGGTTGGAVATTGADTGDSTTSGEVDSSGGVLPPPTILEVDMPAKVALAGPVPFTTTTEHASSARATLDGIDLGALQDEGNGVFSGAVAIYGSVDNGEHMLEVIAEREGLADHRPVPFVVSTPAPGTVAWAMAGPAGSRTRRIALTPERDVVEIGSWLIAGLQRPAIRKRSGISGAEMWADGTLLLDNHEGWATDIAVAPDGRLWVAMNVHEANVWRPRIVLLDATGDFTGIEIPGEAGHTVSGIDNDGTGGCIAVGYGPSGLGDMDVLIWRMNGDHVPVLSGKTWDYQPGVWPHEFTDLATDVVVQGGVAWVVGLSSGKHDEFKVPHNRGFIMRMDIDTAGVLQPVIIAPQTGGFTQSRFFGAAAHPDGVLVTGNGCDDTCDTQRVETALYTAAGARTWFKPEKTSTTAYGVSIALNKHGGVVVAATMRDGTALRGFLLGRVVYNTLAEPFSTPFPASKENSEASGIAIDAFDRVFGGGYRTNGGVIEARTVLAHP